MEVIKRILLVEDDPKDIELTLSTLAEYNLTNEVEIARDGVEALDYVCFVAGCLQSVLPGIRW